MKIKNIEIPFRKDEYGVGFFVENNEKIVYLGGNNACVEQNGIKLSLNSSLDNDILHYSVNIEALQDFCGTRLGLRLGVDTYMSKYPEWNEKFFPTALRCEKNGFWGCFVSPLGNMLGVVSPSNIVSWSHEYNTSLGGDVGHRIYTSSVDFVNSYALPERNIKKPSLLKGEKLHFDIYLTVVNNKDELFEFVHDYGKIVVPKIEKFLIEQDKTNLPLYRNIISKEGEAEASVFVRKDWDYYIQQAGIKALKCQQKLGTHTESWYGFFSMVAYAKIANDNTLIAQVVSSFDKFFALTTKSRKKIKFHKKALPHRLQNVSCMLSLLADFYELTADKKYLDYANDLADWLMSLQARDGSYRSHLIHYTCVIYPAKSMLELALVEKSAGLMERYKIHYDSAYRAISDLQVKLDDIQTEGQMTFEDGMISCEALQLGMLALLCEGEEREKFSNACEYILKKHYCLEQKIVPDCRTYGATNRYWEARYDVNFFSNMLNCPHGWTSWKTYATYYAYMLTGKYEYLLDTMNTIGACLQMIDKDGDLNWAFIPDPCITGLAMQKSTIKEGIKMQKTTIGEQYLPMVSDWFRQPDEKFTFQYLRYIKLPRTWKKDYGGSCDNDVHEHFKCIDETVFGKAFIHFDKDNFLDMFNCNKDNKGFFSKDKYLHTLVVHSIDNSEILFNGNTYKLEKGINIIRI